MGEAGDAGVRPGMETLTSLFPKSQLNIIISITTNESKRLGSDLLTFLLVDCNGKLGKSYPLSRQLYAINVSS